MQYAWTGSYPKNRAPVIATRNDILMNGKKAEDAIIVSPNSSNEAKVTATDPDGGCTDLRLDDYEGKDGFFRRQPAGWHHRINR